MIYILFNLICDHARLRHTLQRFAAAHNDLSEADN